MRLTDPALVAHVQALARRWGLSEGDALSRLVLSALARLRAAERVNQALSPAERSESARRAGLARQAKRRLLVS